MRPAIRVAAEELCWLLLLFPEMNAASDATVPEAALWCDSRSDYTLIT
jgi:hypothetical protein